MTGQDIYQLALDHVREPYVLGSIAPKNDPLYQGPWDCAEFASYLVYQVSGRLYGCANNFGDPAGADAYSGFWARDADAIGKRVSVEWAAATPGAAILRIATRGLIGHLVISDGLGGTIEAYSSTRGVIKGGISGRRWDFGVLIPWIKYERMPKIPVFTLPEGKIFRLTTPMMRDPLIKEFQKLLKIPADGIFGRQTYNAVKAFQLKEGLVADGEVGPKTAEALDRAFLFRV